MKKFVIVTIIIAIIAFFLIMVPFGFRISDWILNEQMIEKYSDNQNYVTLSGEIVEINGRNVIIKCEDLNEYIGYEDELCDFYIYAEQIIELSPGQQIDFVTVPFHFYNGHKLPVVEVKVNGNVLLTFEEGKANLIEWVNATFK